jgi:hypothetical protein
LNSKPEKKELLAQQRKSKHYTMHRRSKREEERVGIPGFF